MWILLLLFTVSECFHEPSQMCRSKENQNCSFQIPYLKENGCLIHTTKTCLQLSSTYSTTDNKLSSESKEKFTVQVYPYTATSVFLSAINITLTVLGSGIEGFSVLIRENAQNLTICRYFNFNGTIPVGTVLFYDCLYNFVEHLIRNVKMTFTAYPMNEKLEYYVSIPSAVTNRPPCNFSALIMVFSENLSQGKVTVKFFTPLELHYIDSYQVELIQHSTNKIISSKIATSSNSTYTQLVEFTSVDEGFYYISVWPRDNKATICSSANTDPFYVTIYRFDKVLLLSLCVVVMLILSLFLILKCLHTYVNIEISPKQVMLIHHDGCSEHTAFIEEFSAYLYNLYKINSCTLYGRVENAEMWVGNDTLETKDPVQWLCDRYHESDAIIYIMSDGLRITLDPKETVYVKEDHHWRNQIPSMQSYIRDQIFHFNQSIDQQSNSPPKIFCKICFPYSSKVEIPPCLKNIGRFYTLPREMKKFLHFLLESRPLIPGVNIYPKLEGTDLMSSEEGRKLLEKHEKIQEAVDNQRHIVKIPKDDSLRKTSETGKSSVMELTQKSLTSSYCETSDVEDAYICSEVEDASICEESDVESRDSYQECLLFYEDGFKDSIRQTHKEFKNTDQNNYLALFVEEEFDLVS